MSKKVAYVTGGMGGIGTAICQRLHKDGFLVIAGCGPTRDFVKWINEQKALGFDFHTSVGNVSEWDIASKMPGVEWPFMACCDYILHGLLQEKEVWGSCFPAVTQTLFTYPRLC